jgi:hypothetical protein
MSKTITQDDLFQLFAKYEDRMRRLEDALRTTGERTLYTPANDITSFDIAVDSTLDKLWIIEYEMLVVYNGTVYIRPNASTLGCTELRAVDKNVDTGGALTDTTGSGISTQGARILNYPMGAAAGETYATGRFQMSATARSNGERPAFGEVGWEQTVGSANIVAGFGSYAWRMGQYGTITSLRIVCDQVSGIKSANFWITRK